MYTHFSIGWFFVVHGIFKSAKGLELTTPTQHALSIMAIRGLTSFVSGFYVACKLCDGVQVFTSSLIDAFVLKTNAPREGDSR
jgi:hypothetical protein